MGCCKVWVPAQSTLPSLSTLAEKCFTLVLRDGAGGEDRDKAGVDMKEKEGYGASGASAVGVMSWICQFISL